METLSSCDQGQGHLEECLEDAEKGRPVTWRHLETYLLALPEAAQSTSMTMLARVMTSASGGKKRESAMLDQTWGGAASCCL